MILVTYCKNSFRTYVLCDVPPPAWPPKYYQNKYFRHCCRTSRDARIALVGASGGGGGSPRTWTLATADARSTSFHCGAVD